MGRGYNLPDNVSPNDPDAPWNKDGNDSGPQGPVDEAVDLAETDVECPECGWVGSLDGTDIVEGTHICPVCDAELDVTDDLGEEPLLGEEEEV